MAATDIDTRDSDSPARINAGNHASWGGRVDDKFFDKTVITEPKMQSWLIVAAGSIVPLGLAGAALAATYITTHERVATTAWIVVAVVGTASVISAAAVSHRRIVSLERENDRKNEHGRGMAGDAEIGRKTIE